MSNGYAVSGVQGDAVIMVIRVMELFRVNGVSHLVGSVATVPPYPLSVRAHP